MSTQVPVPGDIEAKMEASLAEIEKEVTGKDLSSKPATEPPSEPAKEEAVKTDEQPAEPNSVEASQPAVNKDYEDWLTKWGGPNRDPNVAARASWDANNRLSEQANRIKELEAKTTAPPAEVVAKEPEPEPVPADVKRFDDKLRAIEEHNKILQEDFGKVQDAKDAARKEINRLVDQIAGNDLELDADVAARKSLKAKRAEFEYLLREEQAIRVEHERLKDKYDSTKTLKQITERTLALSSAREAEIRDVESRREEAAIEQFGVAFFKALPEVASQGDQKIPESLMDDWKEFAKTRSHARLRVEDLKTEDIPAFLADAKKAFLSTLDKFHRSKAAEYAKQKTLDASVNAPDGKAAVAGEVKKTGFKSRQEVERFMEHASNF